jgi:hypothetical protein
MMVGSVLGQSYGRPAARRPGLAILLPSEKVKRKYEKNTWNICFVLNGIMVSACLRKIMSTCTSGGSTKNLAFSLVQHTATGGAVVSTWQ